MGKLAYLSKHDGIGGTIKETPDDFKVEEMAGLPKLSVGGEYSYFMLNKRGKSTQEAVDAIALATGVPQSRFSAAGQKDRQASTTQLVSAYHVGKEALLNARLPPSLSIEYLGRGDSPVKIGALAGNKFIIKVAGANAKNPKKTVAAIFDDLSGVFPNYFGPQRFGMRNNSHVVGRLLLQGKNEDAAIEYLCGGDGERNEEAHLARKRLLGENDFASALSYFPHSLSYERRMLEVLSGNPHDFVRAFLCLPRPILLIFVHAYQSHLFNKSLSEKIKAGGMKDENSAGWGKFFGSGAFGFPSENSISGKKWAALRLLGYESSPDENETRLLENDELRIIDFRVRQMPMLGAKGGWRSALAPLAGFSFADSTFNFSLPSGSYATSALREFMDAKG